MKRYLLTQSTKRNLPLVQKRGYDLKKVWIQTPELCLTAVRQNGYALMYVKEQTPEMCRIAVQDHPAAIHFVKNQTLELCSLAMSLDPTVHIFVHEPFKQLFTPFTFVPTDTIDIPPDTIDPVTFLPPQPGDIFAFYKLFPIASYDTIRQFIDTQYKDSNLYSVYSPFHGIMIFAKDVKWVYLR
jgi:hypothetical protein